MKDRYLAIISALGVTLCMCACGSMVRNDQDIWNTYDYRHPVPGDVDVPAYYYQDNDDAYTPPRDFGCDPDNIQMCE